MIEVVVTTEAISRAKLQSHHHQQTNTKCFTGGCPVNSVKALKGNLFCLCQGGYILFRVCLFVC